MQTARRSNASTPITAIPGAWCARVAAPPASPNAVSGIQNGCVFVTLEGGGYAEPVILAAAKFAAPLIWRLGGVVSVRYQGRFG